MDSVKAHSWHEQACELHEGDHVDLHHVTLTVPVGLVEGSRVAEAGVVHERVDAHAALQHVFVHVEGSILAGEVAGKRVRLDAAGGLQLLLQRLQLAVAPGDEQQAFISLGAFAGPMLSAALLATGSETAMDIASAALVLACLALATRLWQKTSAVRAS